MAIIDKADFGPHFGAEGLIIPLQPGRERLAKSRLGTYYARRAGGGRSLFAPGEEKRAQLVDLKVGLLAGYKGMRHVQRIKATNSDAHSVHLLSVSG